MNCNSGLAYNNYSGIEMMPYKIIAYMVENNEDIFKLLKYNSPDALDQPNLTCDEKTSMIYGGQPNSTDYKIFSQPITDDAFTEMVSQFRVYPDIIIPENHIRGLVTFNFEILSHSKINTLNNYSTRLSWMLQNTIKTLNGINIDGVGSLFFDKSASSYNYAKYNIYNGKNYIGYNLMLSTWVGSVPK